MPTSEKELRDLRSLLGIETEEDLKSGDKPDVDRFTAHFQNDTTRVHFFEKMCRDRFLAISGSIVLGSQQEALENCHSYFKITDGSNQGGALLLQAIAAINVGLDAVKERLQKTPASASAGGSYKDDWVKALLAGVKRAQDEYDEAMSQVQRLEMKKDWDARVQASNDDFVNQVLSVVAAQEKAKQSMCATRGCAHKSSQDREEEIIKLKMQHASKLKEQEDKVEALIEELNGQKRLVGQLLGHVKQQKRFIEHGVKNMKGAVMVQQQGMVDAVDAMQTAFKNIRFETE